MPKHAFKNGRSRKVPVNLTLSPEVRAVAENHAAALNESMSQMVERLLRQEMAKPQPPQWTPPPAPVFRRSI